MSWGSILVGIAITMVVLTYIARPLVRREADPDKTIEAWVKLLSVAAPTSYTQTPAASPAAEEVIAFCPQCGRKVAPDHRFCPGCGNPLPRPEGGFAE